MLKRMISLLLVLAILVGYLPMTTSAEETENTEVTEVTEVTEETTVDELPVEEITVLSETQTEPTGVQCEPTESVTDPSEETTVPTEPVTEPSVETTVPVATETESVVEEVLEDTAFNAASTESIVASGTCGDNLSWKLDNKGKLTISGTGAMKDYSYGAYANKSPWCNADNIVTVEILDGVTTIGDVAFEYCGGLTTISIPDSVVSIGENAFSCCDSLLKVTIPRNVASIHDRAFYQCDKLMGIWVSEANEKYSSDNDGVLFDKNKTRLIQAPGGLNKGYTVPDSVTTIDDNAFAFCTKLPSVIIANSVISIGDSAFISCSSMTSVVIPNGVKSIGTSAFSHCSSLTGVSIPNTMTSIKPYTFNFCSSMKTVEIPDGISTIGNFAFDDCSSLLKVIIPASVICIGRAAFNRCDALSGIWVKDSNTFFSSDNKGVLFNKQKTKLIQAPGGLTGNYTIPDGVTNISGFAFTDCEGLIGVVVPKSVTNIENAAFNGKSSLMDVYYEGSKEQWNRISIGLWNEVLTNATLHTDYKPEALSGWQKAYYDFIVADKAGKDFDWEYVTYELVYLNEDAIPELWVDYSFTFAGSQLMSYYDDQLMTDSFASGTLTYEEKSNAFYHSWGRMGYFSDTVYLISQEGFKKLASGSRQMDDYYTSIISWKWNDVEVSEAVYNQNLNGYVNPDVAQKTGSKDGEIYDYEGILDYLLNYKESEYRFVISPKETDLAVKTGQYLDITFNLYCGEKIVTNWEQPQLSIGNLGNKNVISYLNWKETEDGGYVLRIKGENPGTADLVVHDAQSATTVKVSVDVSLAEVHEYVDNSAVTINVAGSAYAYYIGAPNQAFRYIVNGKESVAQSNKKGVFCVALGTFRNCGVHDVTVEITHIGDELLNSVLVFNTAVTVTALEFTQSWLASFDASVAPKLSGGADLKLGPIEAEATFGKAEAKFGLGVAMNITREFSEEGETLELTSDKKASAEGELKSGITAEVIQPKLSIVEVSAGANASVSGTYGIKINNYSASNGAQQKAVAMYLLGEALYANSMNLMYKPFYDYLAMPIYIESGCEVIEGSTADVNASAGADALAVKIRDGDLYSNDDDNTLFSVADIGVDISATISGAATNAGNITKQTSYKSSSDIALFSGNLIHFDDFKLEGAYLSRDFLGKDIKIATTKSKEGTSVEATFLSSSFSEPKWFILGEHSVADYGKYTFREDTLDGLIQNTEHFENYVNGNRIIVSLFDVVEMGKYLSTSDLPISYSRQTKDQVLYTLPLELGASLGIGVDLGVELSYIEDTSYTNRTGVVLDDTLLVVSESNNLSAMVEANKRSIDEIIVNVMYSLSNDVKEFFTKVSDSIRNGVESAWAWIDAQTDNVKNWIVSLTYADSGNSSFATSYTIAVHSQERNTLALNSGIKSSSYGNYGVSKTNTIGRPVLVSVTDSVTGEQVTDLCDESLTITIRYAQEDLQAAGLSKNSDIVLDGGIAIYRYSDNGDYFEYIGGENDLEAMTVTARITKPGQYVLAADNCAPSIRYLDISDFHANPTITAYIDDLSGLNVNGFKFALDGDVKVDGGSIADCYDAKAGVFTYTVPENKPLEEGQHTISFTLIDTTGNSETYEYSFSVDLTAPVVSDVTVTGRPNEGSVVQIRAKVSDSNLSNVYAVFSKRMSDGTWQQEVITAMGDMGDGVWGLDYEGGGSSIRVSVKAVDIAENTADSEKFEVYPYAESITISQEYLMLKPDQTVQLSAEVNPSELNSNVRWGWYVESGNGVIDVSPDGKVTAVSKGTAYVLASVSDGEKELSARCRIDVAETEIIDNAEIIQLDGIQLSTTKVTSELYSTKYSELDILLMLPQNYSAASVTADVPEDIKKSVAIDSVKFADKAVASLFSLVAKDDRTVQIVPTESAVAGGRMLKGSYNSAIIVRVQGREYTSEALTITVKKSQPKLKVTVPNFNSFYTGESQEIAVTGATVAAVTLNPDKAQPDWLTLEGQTLRLNENAPRKSVSGKLNLLVYTKEWAIPAEVALRVKNDYKEPTLKLSAKTIALNTFVQDSATVTVTADPADYDLSKLDYRLTDNTGRIEKTGEVAVDYKDGRFTIGATSLTKGNYKLHISTDGSKEVVLIIKTIEKAPSVSFKVSGNPDISIPDSAATVTPSFRNYNGSFTLKNIGHDLLEVIQTGNSISVKCKEVTLPGTYTLNLKLILADGSEVESTAKVKVKKTALKLKLSSSKLVLNKLYSDKSSVTVTSATKGYTLYEPVWQLMDKSGGKPADGKLDIHFIDDKLMISVNEKTEYGETYRILVRAGENHPAQTLTVTILEEGKSKVTATLKAQGAIDVVRDGTPLTLTPAYKNLSAQTVREETLVFYKTVGKQQEDASDLFAYTANEDGTFTVTKAERAQLDHSCKYTAKLITSINGTVVAESRAISLGVKMGSAKLTATAKDGVLFVNDKYDRAEFSISAADCALNNISAYQIRDKKYRDIFQIAPCGENETAIVLKAGKINELLGKSTSKTVTVNILVWLDGNAGEKANVSIPMTFSVCRAPLAENVRIIQGRDYDVTGKTLEVGEEWSFLLSGHSEPENAIDSFVWSSSDPSVAVVAPERGEVWGKSPGTAVITCSSIDGSGKSASIIVRVLKSHWEKLEINKTYCVGSVLNHQSMNLRAFSDWGCVYPRDQYTCSPSILTEPGTQEVTVTYRDITQTFTVEVLDFYELSVELRNYGGPGYNEDERVYWAMYVTGRYEGNYVDHKFWDDVPTLSDREYDFAECWENAQNGQGTEWGYGCSDTGYGNYHGGHAFLLPDDPALAGTYDATLTFGDLTWRVRFTLEYQGDYTSGTGWKVSDARWWSYHEG